jgi:hypothetical protein
MLEFVLGGAFLCAIVVWYLKQPLHFIIIGAMLGGLFGFLIYSTPAQGFILSGIVIGIVLGGMLCF